MNIIYNLGVILALVMLAGSVSYSFADDAYISPRKQLESSVAPEDIQCNDNRILVLRTNGSPACVTERTAEKMGWTVVVNDNVEDMTATTKKETSAIPEAFAEKEEIMSSEYEMDFVQEAKNVDDESERLPSTVNIQASENNISSSVIENNPEFVNIQTDNAKIPYVMQEDKPTFADTKTTGSVMRTPAPISMSSWTQNNWHMLFEQSPDDSMQIPTRQMINQMESDGTYTISETPKYLVDPVAWAPKYSPEGQELKFFIFGEDGSRSLLQYYYAPNTVDFDRDSTNMDIYQNQGIKITISTQEDQRPMTEGEIVTDKAVYAYKWVDYSYNGHVTVSIDGIDENGKFDPHSMSGITYYDDKIGVDVASYHYTFEELRPIFESMFKEK